MMNMTNYEEFMSGFLSEEDLKYVEELLQKMERMEKPIVSSSNSLKFLLPVILIFSILIIPFRGNNLLMMFGFGRQFIILASISIFTPFIVILLVLLISIKSLMKLKPELIELAEKFPDIEKLPEEVLSQLSDDQIEAYKSFKNKLKGLN